MDERTIHTFKAIGNLLNDLRTFFKNDKPLALYDRLVQKTPFLNTESIKRHIDIFERFISLYKTDILYEKDLPEDVTIEYKSKDDIEGKSKIFISIGRFMKTAPPKEKAIIQSHLLTICAILSPDDKTLEKLDSIGEKLSSLKIDTSTKSGEFIQNLLSQAEEATKGADIKSPADAISTMLGSGLFQNMLSSLTQSTESGALDPQDLLSTLLKSVSTLTGGEINKVVPLPDTD